MGVLLLDTSTFNPDGCASSFSIVSFDIGKEIMEAISPPKSISEKNWYKMYLVELGRELCLVNLDNERMDIWIFK